MGTADYGITARVDGHMVPVVQRNGKIDDDLIPWEQNPIQGGGGGGGLFGGKTIEVDATNGDDTAAALDVYGAAFATVWAAYAAAASGDVIVVRPGAYTQATNLIGGRAIAEITFYFMRGATLTFTSDSAGFGSNIDNNNKVRILGHGRFVKSTASSLLLTLSSNDTGYAWDWTFEFDEIELGDEAGIGCGGIRTVGGNGARFSCRGRRMYGSSRSPYLEFTGSAPIHHVDIDEVVPNDAAEGGSGVVSISHKGKGVYRFGRVSGVYDTVLSKHSSSFNVTVGTPGAEVSIYAGIVRGQTSFTCGLGSVLTVDIEDVTAWQSPTDLNGRGTIVADFGRLVQLDPNCDYGAVGVEPGADGKIFLRSGWIDASADADGVDNAAIVLWDDAGTFILGSGVVLVAGAAAESIALDGPASITIPVYGTAVANKAKNAAVTIAVGTLIVNAAVV